MYSGVYDLNLGVLSLFSLSGEHRSRSMNSGISLGLEEFITGSGGSSPAAFSVQKSRQQQRDKGGQSHGGGHGSRQSGQSRGGGGGRRGNGGRGRGIKNDNHQPKCQLCGVLGHTAPTCYKWYEKDP
ncbi:PREDICTED: cold shock protein 2-like [Ipomoea nil]|uniref:cold shock protein 2-like n=1 Tax=Ipomoea nil TaxID=35883 RepID=UPI0009013125|nr:PREDICTED: cold shock protein 2-like [Ipomoea nil]